MNHCWAEPLYSRLSYLVTVVLHLDPRNCLLNKDSPNAVHFFSKQWHLHCNLPPQNSYWSEAVKCFCLGYTLMHRSDLRKSHCLREGIPNHMTQGTTVSSALNFSQATSAEFWCAVEAFVQLWMLLNGTHLWGQEPHLHFHCCTSELTSFATEMLEWIMNSANHEISPPISGLRSRVLGKGEGVVWRNKNITKNYHKTWTTSLTLGHAKSA